MKTGNSCLLDTSIIIHPFKNHAIAKQLNGFDELFVPSIAVGELFYGAYRSENVQKHLDQVHLLLQDCKILNPDTETAELYGRIKSALMGKGKPIPENDIWIAAIAIKYDLPLFTDDKHFKEIDGINLI